MKDFYDLEYMSRYDNRDNRSLENREISALKLISKIVKNSKKSNLRLLDIGCGDGFFLRNIQSRIPGIGSIDGGEYSDNQREIAHRSNGLDIHFIDLTKNLPFNDEDYDIIYSGEVIEHLYDPDKMLAEVNRVLKVGGYLVLTTPNMNSWISRILFPFGMQPINYECSTKSSSYGYGLLKRIKKQDWPVGHVRLFNSYSLRDILSASGFDIEAQVGATFEFMPRILSYFDRFFCIFPSLSSGLIFVAKKTKSIR